MDLEAYKRPQALQQTFQLRKGVHIEEVAEIYCYPQYTDQSQTKN